MLAAAWHYDKKWMRIRGAKSRPTKALGRLIRTLVSEFDLRPSAKWPTIRFGRDHEIKASEVYFLLCSGRHARGSPHPHCASPPRIDCPFQLAKRQSRKLHAGRGLRI